MTDQIPTSANRNRAAFAFVSLLAAAAIGLGYIVRSGGDPGHLVGGFNATPAAEPTTCRFTTVRGPSEVWTTLGLELADGGSGLAAAKSCFHVPPGCEGTADEEIHILYKVDGGVNPAPCEVVDGSTYCPDATVPWVVFADLCATEVIPLPGGIEYLTSDEWERPYIPGEPVFEVWTAEHKDAPWLCACGAPGFVPDAGQCERFKPAGNPPGRIDGGVWEPVPAVEESLRLQPESWRGNCRRMPCDTWGGMAALPAECRVHACDGLECGMGRAGELCGPIPGYRTVDAEGHDLTCAANKWQRECDDGASGKPGRWYVKVCP